jgi:5-methylcytosine-specific restriction protein A
MSDLGELIEADLNKAISTVAVRARPGDREDAARRRLTMGRTGGWQGSTRHDRLPADWPARRARVLRQQPTCRLAYDCCTTVSTQVDHVRAGDDHRYINLQGACAPCHARKSAGEGTAAHRAKGWATTRRAPEPHPGTRTAAASTHTPRHEHTGQARVDALARTRTGEAAEPDKPGQASSGTPGGDPPSRGPKPG